MVAHHLPFPGRIPARAASSDRAIGTTSPLVPTRSFSDHDRVADPVVLIVGDTVL